jgi:uncharacterized protein YprB with RNaseH-like and TPR domain
MGRFLDAYLDIETTGLSFVSDSITVIGIYLCNSSDSKFLQLVGEQVTRENLIGALHNVRSIYTYNGRRFDLPFIHNAIGVDLESLYEHCDLMYACWRNNLKGGFKAVERQLKISRRLQDMDGYKAVQLWKHYTRYGNKKALELLLEYNREDAVNLKKLRERLMEYPQVGA